MNALVFRDQQPTGLPTPLAIQFGDIAEGESKPTLYSLGKLSWHCAIRFPSRTLIHTWLIQGHGKTPRESVAAAIVSAREELAVHAKMLASLESHLGVSGMTDAEVVFRLGAEGGAE